jgi:hypothetical protein
MEIGYLKPSEIIKINQSIAYKKRDYSAHLDNHIINANNYASCKLMQIKLASQSQNAAQITAQSIQLTANFHESAWTPLIMK